MPTVTGQREVSEFFAQAPAKMQRVLSGAVRAGAKVVSDEIKLLTPSQEVRENLRISAKAKDSRITVRVDLKPGWPNSVGTWLEYGTEGHFISVDDSQRAGRTVRRINQTVQPGSLKINGRFVGKTVWHPGARPHPAFRPALDTKEAEAIAAMQAYINRHVGRSGIADVQVAKGQEN